MVVLLGQMQLPAPQDPDPSDDYFNGTISGGGLWTALTRSSDHDHTGGVNGKPISIASIPDGSITTSKLDPSVLAPYSLVDGSKPFTGQVVANADLLVRDTLYFGAKPAGVGDVFWRRASATALRTDANVGVGVPPVAWATTQRALQVGSAGSVWGSLGTGSPRLTVSVNAAYTGGASTVALHETWPAVVLQLADGEALLQKAPAVAAGAAQTLTSLLRVLESPTFAGSVVVHAPAGSLFLDAQANYVAPHRHAAVNLGAPTQAWATVYAQTGTIQPSLAEAKTDITPLAPEDALAAVRATDPVLFDYRPPERGSEWYELPDDPEQAAQVLEQRMRAAPLEEAARHQAGFVLHDETGGYQTDPLFETGFGQSNAANTAGILLAAIQALDTRLQALEGA